MEYLTKLKLITGILALFGCPIAFLHVVDSLVTEAQRTRLREWYARLWDWLRARRWLAMPGTLVHSVKRLRSAIASWEDRLPFMPWLLGFYTVTLVIFVISCLGFYGQSFSPNDVRLFRDNLLLTVGAFSCAGISFGYYVYEAITQGNERNPRDSVSAKCVVGFLLFTAALAYPVNAILFLNMFLGMPTGNFVMFIGVLLISPAICPLLTVVFSAIAFVGKRFVWWEHKPEPTFFSISLAASFAITALAIIIGNIISPEDVLPRNIQMFFSNVIFDGITIVATLAILDYAVRDDTPLDMPPAIVLTMLTSAGCAILSLWCGLGQSRARQVLTLDNERWTE